MPGLCWMTIRVRIYPVRWRHVRVIWCDGKRWRRLSEPWDVLTTRALPTTANPLPGDEGAHHCPWPAPNIPG